MAMFGNIRLDNRNKAAMLKGILFSALILSTTSICMAQFSQGMYPKATTSGPISGPTQEITPGQFGALLLKNAPPEIRNGDSLAKARYGYKAYMDMLSQNGVSVNDNLLSRAWFGVQAFDFSRWTCGDHVNNVHDIFVGMGIDEYSLFKIVATRPYTTAIGGPVPYNFLDVNVNHVALALASKRNAEAFDAWADGEMAKQQGQVAYSQPSTGFSEWNGMDLRRWVSIMKEMGYNEFTDGEHDGAITVTADNFDEILKAHGCQIPRGSFERTIEITVEPAEPGWGQGSIYSYEPMPGYSSQPMPGQMTTFKCRCCSELFWDYKAYSDHERECCSH
jgi:hypothetical protein